MLRKTAWRNTASVSVNLHQEQAFNTTIFIVKAYGPTGFLLKEQGESKQFKVFLGDPHSCTCPVFHREREPCKHICWLLLRKFRLPREHEYSFQQGLMDRQVLEVLRGIHQPRSPGTEGGPCVATTRPNSKPVLGLEEDGSVKQKQIQAHDMCPICQDELLSKQLPVCYCRFGCGNNVHISCMKLWAHHQDIQDKQAMVKCPLCREDFSSQQLLLEQVKNSAQLYATAERERADKHLGTPCHNCQVCPIIGRCFRCTVCSYYYLCEHCSKTCHHKHEFVTKTKRREKWRPAGHHPDGDTDGRTHEPESDSMAEPLPEHVLQCLPAFRVRMGSRLLAAGAQCRICLQSFALGQSVRNLPCRHKFHTECVDRLLQKSNSCPLDGYVLYNPLTWGRTEKQSGSRPAPRCPQDGSRVPARHSSQELFIPGVPLLRPFAAGGAHSSQALPSDASESVSDLGVTSGLRGLCVGATLAGTVARSALTNRIRSSVQGGAPPHHSQKTGAKRGALLPRRRVLDTQVREQEHDSLFVGPRRTVSEHGAVANVTL